MWGNPFPALHAFDCDDEFGVWLWTWRVWSGWKYPQPPFGLRYISINADLPHPTTATPNNGGETVMSFLKANMSFVRVVFFNIRQQDHSNGIVMEEIIDKLIQARR